MIKNAKSVLIGLPWCVIIRYDGDAQALSLKRLGVVLCPSVISLQGGNDSMFYAIFALSLLFSVFSCRFVAKKRGDAALDRIINASTVAFIALTLLDTLLPDLFMCVQSADTLAAMNGTKLHAVVRWLNLVSFTVLPIAVFQKNKYFERIACFFCLPMATVNVAFYFQYIGYFTANSYSGLQTMRILPQAVKAFLITEGFRSVYFGITCLLQLTALILLTYRRRADLPIRKGEWLNTLLILVGVIYISMPIYAPQYLFGLVNVMLIRFSPVHFAWIFSIVAIIVVFYFIFRNKPYELRYIFVLALSWALMLQFSQMFTASSELNVMKLPLQLCNLGSYLALIMLLKKNARIYHFALIVNVIGAIIAIAILDISKDVSHITNLWVVHYVVEHTKVMAIPILCLVLKIFDPIKKKDARDFTVSFTAYYLFVLVLGTVSNGFYRIFEGNEIQNFFYANHLFMFDKEIAHGLVGFTDPLFESCVIRFGAFELYPLVQALVYVVFLALSLIVFALIYLLTRKHRRPLKNG